MEAVPDAHLLAYRFMLRARLLDEKFAALYRAGKIHGGVFLGRGQEALSAALGVSLTKFDVFAPLIRDQGNDKLPDLIPRELAVVAPLIALLLVLGVYPKVALDVINPAAVVAVKALLPPKNRGWFRSFFTLSAT